MYHKKVSCHVSIKVFFPLTCLVINLLFDPPSILGLFTWTEDIQQQKTILIKCPMYMYYLGTYCHVFAPPPFFFNMQWGHIESFLFIQIYLSLSYLHKNWQYKFMWWLHIYIYNQKPYYSWIYVVAIHDFFKFHR